MNNFPDLKQLFTTRLFLHLLLFFLCMEHSACHPNKEASVYEPFADCTPWGPPTPSCSALGMEAAQSGHCPIICTQSPFHGCCGGESEAGFHLGHMSCLQEYWGQGSARKGLQQGSNSKLLLHTAFQPFNLSVAILEHAWKWLDGGMSVLFSLFHVFRMFC